LVLRGPSQMLSLNELKAWHCFRLAWGDGDPLADYADSPNGRDDDWTLYFCSNGRKQPILAGKLPDGWWDMDDDEHYHYLQNVM
jgi:hypothetical protein